LCRLSFHSSGEAVSKKKRQRLLKVFSGFVNRSSLTIDIQFGTKDNNSVVFTFNYRG
jgi:hypothetical protein